ncbi:MAG: hypothetical protein H6Q69_4528 [Firmicutes bacterium]|nr:hypothetical protein [Bacillota bacterium]
MNQINKDSARNGIFNQFSRKRWSELKNKVNVQRAAQDQHISDVSVSVKDDQRCESDWLEKAMATIHL